MYIDIWIVWYCRWRAPQAPASSTVISTALSTTGQSNVNWQCQKPLDVCILEEIIHSVIGRLKPYSILLIFRGWCWLWLCVANGLCLLIAHQLCWERIGQRGEERGRDYGLWMVEVSTKFRKISLYLEKGSFSLLKAPTSTVTLKNLLYMYYDTMWNECL